MTDLNALYEKAVKLGNRQQNGIAVERPLEQLAMQTKRLLKKTALEGTQQATRLLARKGIDAHGLRNLLDSVHAKQAAEPMQQLRDTDVDGYLRNQHELLLISAIEEIRNKVRLLSVPIANA